MADAPGPDPDALEFFARPAASELSAHAAAPDLHADAAASVLHARFAESDLHARFAESDLHARFAATPYAFGFYQAMRRLEAHHSDRPRFGRAIRPEQEPVRLAQEPSLVFAPSTLHAWTAGKHDLPPRLLVNFFRPVRTQRTAAAAPHRIRPRPPAQRLRHHLPALRRYLSSSCLVAVLYRAWASAQPTVSFDRPEDDRFALFVGALIGLGMKSLRNRDAMPDLTKLHFAGHLSTQTRHAEGLGAILSEFFWMPVSVACFIGAWLNLQAADFTRLAGTPETARLGMTTLVGSRVWSRQHKFRIVFGPLDLADYLRLLPGGTSFRRLIPIVRNYAGDTLAWDVNLVLKRDQVPAIRLGRQGRLGWTTWLTPRRAVHDAADLFLDASAEGFARKFDTLVPEPPADLLPDPPPELPPELLPEVSDEPKPAVPEPDEDDTLKIKPGDVPPAAPPTTVNPPVEIDA